jgi:hypothetical protein
MAHQQVPMWAAEADIDEEVDSILAIGNYGQGHFEDGATSAAFRRLLTLITVSSTNPTSSVRRGRAHRHSTTHGSTGGFRADPRRGQGREHATCIICRPTLMTYIVLVYRPILPGRFGQ